MRKTVTRRIYKPGDIRITEKFFWLPTYHFLRNSETDGHRICQWRWLERSSFSQKLEAGYMEPDYWAGAKWL